MREMRMLNTNYLLIEEIEELRKRLRFNLNKKRTNNDLSILSVHNFVELISNFRSANKNELTRR